MVVLGDRAPGSGASNNNAGWIVPSSSGPLPAPGIVLQTMRWMLRRDSPVYVQPSLEPSFVHFMIQMLGACNAPAFSRGFAADLALAQGVMEDLDAYVADGIEFEMHSAGLLRVFVTRQAFQKAMAGVERRRQAGLDPEVLTGDQARSIEPELSPLVVGAIKYPHERHIQPASLVAGLVQRCRSLGVELVENRVAEARVRSPSLVELSGPFGDTKADACIIAAGAWSGRVSRLFGVKLPIRPGKGYCADYAPAPFQVQSPIMLSETNVALSPLDSGMRLAGTMEFGPLNESIDEIRIRAVKEAPRRYFRNWDPEANAAVSAAGLRPMTPDGLAVIGRLAPHSNVYVATGHAMHGVTLATRTATELAKLIVDGKTPSVLDPYSPKRFK